MHADHRSKSPARVRRVLLALGAALTGATLAACDLVTPLPRLDADAGVDLIINVDNSTTLTATVTGGVAPYAYRWSIETQPTDADIELGDDINSLSLTLPTLSVEGRYLLRVLVTDSAGDTDASFVTVTVGADFELVIDSPDSIVVVGETTQPVLSLDGDTSGLSDVQVAWEVIRGEASFDDNTSFTPVVTALSSDTVQLRARVSALINGERQTTIEDSVFVGVNDTTPQVIIANSGGVEGEIRLELYTEAAPNTCANFLRYVDDGFYQGILWHRVVPEFVIQAGAFERAGDTIEPKDGARPPIDSEANNGQSNTRGQMAMALRGSDADSADSQFFINLVDNSNLDDGPPPFTVFARVIEGFDVLNAIEATMTVNEGGAFTNLPTEDIVIRMSRATSEIDVDSNGINDPDNAEVTAEAESLLAQIDEEVRLNAVVTPEAVVDELTFEWLILQGNAELSDRTIADPVVTIRGNQTVELEVRILNPQRENRVVDQASVFVVGIEDPTPRVVIENDGAATGDVVIELFADDAPNAVANFLRYVDAGYYDRLAWHRATPASFIEGGRYFFEDGGYVERFDGVRDAIPDDAPNGRSNLRGTIGMTPLSENPDSAVNQFYVNTVDNTQFDQDPRPRTVFGQVIVGLAVIDAIAAVDTALLPGGFPQAPVDPVVTRRIRREVAPTTTAVSSSPLAVTDLTPRFAHNASRLADGRIMITGGLFSEGSPARFTTLDTISFFDPVTETFTDTFAPLNGGAAVTPTLLAPRSSHVQYTLDDGRVIMIGGNTGATGPNQEGDLLNTVEIFDPQTGTISEGPTIIERNEFLASAKLADGSILVRGNSMAQIFDPQTDTWNEALRFEDFRSRQGFALVRDFGGNTGDERLISFSGSGNPGMTIEALDADPLEGALLDSMLPIRLFDSAASAFADGRVLLTGGFEIGTEVSQAAVYVVDPAADTLETIDPLPELPDGLGRHQIVEFGSVRVVVGGLSLQPSGPTAVDYYAIFDTNTSAWVGNGRLFSQRSRFPVVDLGDGTFLLLGGTRQEGFEYAPLDTVETLRITTP